jgi:hypothetical protein
MSAMRLTSIAVLPLLLCSAFVCAQQKFEFPSTSGNSFVRVCSVIDKKIEDQTHLETQNAVACIAYVEGVVHGVSQEVDFSHAMTNKEPLRPFCLPDDVENAQLVRVVLKFIGNHPEEAHQSTAFLIVLALREAFPCPVKPAAKKQ